MADGHAPLTSGICNYWAQIFTSAVSRVAIFESDNTGHQKFLRARLCDTSAEEVLGTPKLINKAILVAQNI